MLERPSDNHGNENSPPNTRSLFVTQRMALSDQPTRHDTSKHADKVFNRDEARFLDVERDEATLLEDNQHQVISTQQTTSHARRGRPLASPRTAADLQVIRQNLRSILESKDMSLASPSRKKAQITPTPQSSGGLPTSARGHMTPSKIPVRSTKPSPSRSPTLSSIHRQNLAKISVASPTLTQGAFHFFTPTDAAGESVLGLGASSINTQHSRVISSEDDSENDQLQDEELKRKLKEEKRHGKKTGELLHQLHENYKDLLEKYAQAENTIDQLRFQPKMTGDNTPTSNLSGSALHVVPPTKLNVATLRSSGIYHSTTETPLSSIRPVTSTTTTTPIVKSTSPANSGTLESIVFEQAMAPQETILSRGDLVRQSKVFGAKMKSFLTLMDANQLSLAEQKQVYESIKQDYERLLLAFNQTKSTDDGDRQSNLNSELNNMKQLLKEIVKQITQNLLDKSMNSSITERQSRLRRDESHSSQLSVRSSLYNHDELMDQYQKILTAVNTRHTDIDDQRESIVKRYETDRRETEEENSSMEVSQANHSPPPPTVENSRKPYVYVSGDSDNDQQAQSDNVTPIPFALGLESVSFELESLTSTALQQINEQQAHIHGVTRPMKKRNSVQPPNGHGERTKKERQSTTNGVEHEEPLARTHYSVGSLRTNTNDYDSGIGTTNLTKLSRESREKGTKSPSSRVYTSTMDESHCQSLEEEQESISSTSSSRSSASSSASLIRFDVPSASVKDYYHYYRRKPRDPPATNRSRMDERRVTGAYDSRTANSPPDGKIHRSYHTWRPQGSANSQRSRVTPVHRNASIRSSERDQSNHTSLRPVTAPQISPRRHVQPRPISYVYPKPIYRSSLYIDPGQRHQRSQSIVTHVQDNLFLDTRTGTIYRYESNSPRTRQVSSTSSQGQYQCVTCGSITTYYHRHSSPSPVIRPRHDDPGYESEERSIRHADLTSSSESDSDVNAGALNEAYDRAEKMEHSSRILSNSIRRQLKLVFATM